MRGSLQDLVNELERQKASRIDFVADTRSLNAVVTGEGTEDGSSPRVVLRPSQAPGKAGSVGEFVDREGIAVSDAAFGQLCERSEPTIPVRYGRKLLGVNPEACGNLVEETFCQAENRRLFRCLDGRVRAILSDQYRIVDNYDFAFTALEVVQAAGGEVIEATLNDRYMRLKFTTRRVFDVIEAAREESPGSHRFFGSQDFLDRSGFRGFQSDDDFPGGLGTVHPVVTVSNSETGHGGINVRLGILQAMCVNMATVEQLVRNIHVGGKLETGLMSEETIAADSKAIFLKARDAIKAAFDQRKFAAMIKKVRASASTEIESPSTAVGIVAERLELDEDAKASVLEHFLSDYRKTAFGLASAVTRVAQDLDEDRADDLEQFAGVIMQSPREFAAVV